LCCLEYFSYKKKESKRRIQKKKKEKEKEGNRKKEVERERSNLKDTHPYVSSSFVLFASSTSSSSSLS
jgi:hypothetical protein